MSVDLGTAYAKIKFDTSEYKKDITEAKSQLTSFKNQADVVASGLKGVGGAMTSVGKTLTASVTMPIVGIGTAAVKTTMDFDASMSKVAAISGATGKDFDALRAKAREMGSNTKFSASEAAEAMNYMAMAGWKTEDMLEGIEGIMNLAAASGEDLATTSDIVTDALTAFGLSASDSGHFADVLAAASANANTNVSMLGESFKFVAPVAGAMKYNVEDVSVALGLMANSGIKASMGGTSLRNILTNLAKPTKQVQTAMDALGLSLENDDGSMKSLNEVMLMLRDAFGHTNISTEDYVKSLAELDAQLADGTITQKKYDDALETLNKRTFGNADANKAMYAATIAGKTGMSGLLAIVNSSDEDFNALNDAIYSASDGMGMASQQAAIMMDNLTGQLTILKSAFQEILIQIGDILMPYLKDFVTRIQELVTWFSNLDTEQKKQIIKWAAIAASIGPVLLVVGKLTTSLGGLISTGIKVVGWLGKFKTAFGLAGTTIQSVAANGALTTMTTGMTSLVAAAGPVLAVVGTVVALGVALKALYDRNGQFKESVDNLVNSMRNGLIRAFSDVKEGVMTVWNNLQPVFETIKNSLNIDAIDHSMAQLVNSLGRLWDTLQPIFNLLRELGEKILGVQILATLSMIMGVINGIASAIVPAINMINDVINITTDLFSIVTGLIDGLITGDFTNLRTAVSNLIRDIGQYFVDWFDVLWSFISGFYEGVLSTVDNLTGGLITKITTFFTNVGTKIVTFFTVTIPNAFNNFKNVTLPNFINSAKEFFDQLPYNLGVAVGEAIIKLKKFGEDALKWVLTTIPKIIDSIVKFFQQLPGKIWTWLNNTYNKVVAWGSQMKQKATETGRDFVNNIINFVKELPDKFWNLIKSLPDKVNKLKEDMLKAGKNIMNALWDGMKEIWDSILKWLDDVGKKVAGFFKGIEDGMKKVKDATSDSASTASIASVDAGGFASIDSLETASAPNVGSSNNIVNNYNFKYESPKAVDPYEANQLFKQSIRRMEEGFA